MDLFVAEPAGDAKGGIVVIQEAFGVTTHIEAMCELLAEHGWLAAAPALFHREQDQVYSYDDIDVIRPVMGRLSRGGIDADLDASFAHLDHLGFEPTRSGIVGFCMGGSVTLYAAATRALGAAVTFYGGGLGEGRFGFPSGLELAGDIKTPWLGLYGDLDQGIPVDDVEKLRSIVASATVPAEVVRYENGQHGFNCDDRPSVFDEDIAKDARARMFAWFDEHITVD